MHCTECGTLIPEGNKFCTSCGALALGEITKKTGGSRRRKIIAASLSAVVLITAVAFAFGDQILSAVKRTGNSEASVAEVVVNVLCEGAGDVEGGGGSGTLVDATGLVLTNSHVIPQDEQYVRVPETGCLVVLPDADGGPKDIYWAKPLVVEDLSEKYDLAFLQITGPYIDEETGEQRGEYPRSFPNYGNVGCINETPRLGEPVTVYGYPGIVGEGLSLTVTGGRVSSIPGDGTLITDAKITHGNSGGLAVDANGCMVGVPFYVQGDEFESYGVIIPFKLLSEFNDEFETGDLTVKEIKSDETKLVTTVEEKPKATTTPNPRNLEDKGSYPALPQFGQPTINRSVPYYAPNIDVLLSTNGQYTPVSGDLSQYDYSKLYVQWPASFSPSGYVYWNLGGNLSGYVKIKKGKVGNSADLFVKDPSACGGTKDGWFNKAGIKIRVYNERFTSEGYLNDCEQLSVNPNADPPYYYIGDLLPDTYNVDLTLPAGWKVSEISGNVLSSPGSSLPRQITIGKAGPNEPDPTLWFYIEPR